MRRALPFLAWLLLLRGLERLRPARPSRGEGARRVARNLAVAAGAAAVAAKLEQPLALATARHVERRRLGLFRGANRAAGLLALDYTLYVWHVLLHRAPLLWRFHAVHHADRELDTTTALRFHFGELALSIGWRLGQIRLLGIDPATLRLWQSATAASVLFHHANLRLPPGLERALRWLVVTPGLHAIHHSTRADERGSNWSSGLTLWDRLHGTLRDEAAPGLRIGLPEGHSAAGRRRAERTSNTPASPPRAMTPKPIG